MKEKHYHLILGGFLTAIAILLMGAGVLYNGTFKSGNWLMILNSDTSFSVSNNVTANSPRMTFVPGGPMVIDGGNVSANNIVFTNMANILSYYFLPSIGGLPYSIIDNTGAIKCGGSLINVAPPLAQQNNIPLANLCRLFGVDVDNGTVNMMELNGMYEACIGNLPGTNAFADIDFPMGVSGIIHGWNNNYNTVVAPGLATEIMWNPFFGYTTNQTSTSVVNPGTNIVQRSYVCWNGTNAYQGGRTQIWATTPFGQQMNFYQGPIDFAQANLTTVVITNNEGVPYSIVAANGVYPSIQMGTSNSSGYYDPHFIGIGNGAISVSDNLTPNTNTLFTVGPLGFAGLNSLRMPIVTTGTLTYYSGSTWIATNIGGMYLITNTASTSVISNNTGYFGSGIWIKAGVLQTGSTITATNINPITIISSNAAPFVTLSNPTNSYTTGTLYTNLLNSRAQLVGAAVVNATVANSANVTLFYTNSGVGYSLPMQDGAGVAQSDIFPFNVPLSTNATFQFIVTAGGSASATVTNVVLWR